MNVFRLIPFLLFAVLVIFLWRGLSLAPQEIPSAQLGHPIPAFKLQVLGDKKNELTALNFQGKVSLLNVWASWCAACVEEQVFLMHLASKGVPIYGLNYKDDESHAQQWLLDWGNPYQLIGADSDGKVAIDLGVYGAPETFLVDAKGVIRFRHVGVLDEQSFTRDFLPKIRQLQGPS